MQITKASLSNSLRPAATVDGSTGSILTEVLQLSGPTVLALLLQTSHQFVNTFWVGHLGINAVAAVSFSYPIIFMLVTLVGGLTVSAPILVAQYAGARRPDMVNQIAAQALLIILLLSALLSVSGFFATPVILHFLHVEPDVFRDALSYLHWSFASMLFIFFVIAYQAILRGIGNVKLPLYIACAAVALNMILDPLLIFGWGPFPPLGVTGAA